MQHWFCTRVYFSLTTWRMSAALMCALLVVLQLNLLIDRVEDAVKDFEHTVSLHPDFAIAHVQKCYTGNSPLNYSGTGIIA